MRMSNDTKAKIIVAIIIIAIIGAILWLGIYVFPDKVQSRQDYALIVGAGVEYEVKPSRSGSITKFNTIKAEPQYYVEFEVDGETYKLIGDDLYYTYKDCIGGSVEITIRTDYYPFISKFKKVVTIPRAFES